MKKATKTLSKAAKGIIWIIISVVSGGLVSSYWFSWNALLPLLACIGGLVVFGGLWIEKEAEEKNDAYFSPFEKPFKKMETCGWWLLMLGIILEVIAAGVVTVIEDINTARNDPKSQLVFDANATLVFAVDETYSSDVTTNPPVPATYAGAIGEMYLCGKKNILNPIADINSKGQILPTASDSPRTLTSIDYQRGGFHTGHPGGSEQKEYIYSEDFFWPKNEKYGYELVGGTKFTVSQDYDEVTYIVILLNFLPAQADIKSGEVDLEINDAIHKKFYVIPHKKIYSPKFSVFFATDSPTNWSIISKWGVIDPP